MVRTGDSRAERVCADLSFTGHLYGGVVILVILGAQSMPFDTAGWGLVVGMPLLLGIVPVGALAIVLGLVRVLLMCVPSSDAREPVRSRDVLAAAWPHGVLAVLTVGSVVLYGIYVFRPEDRREPWWPWVVAWSSVWVCLSVVLPLMWFLRWRRRAASA